MERACFGNYTESFIKTLLPKAVEEGTRSNKGTVDILHHIHPPHYRIRLSRVPQWALQLPIGRFRETAEART